MFNENFYPTPPEIIEKMVAPYFTTKTIKSHYGFNFYDEDVNITNKVSILDPSAGSGNLLDAITQKLRSHQKRDIKMYAIEIEPELQYILRGKEYSVIGTDFLKFQADMYFDLIIMNPPFHKGDEHFLKAWTILKGGSICCLLNAETINNPHTSTRQLLAKILKDNNATITQLGPCFQNADRKTNVHVVMIHIDKKMKDTDKLNFQFSQVTSEKGIHINKKTFENQVATRDTVNNMILQFEKLKEYYVKYLEALQGLQFYSTGLLTERKSIFDLLNSNGSNTQKYNGFTMQVRQQMWQTVTKHLDIEQLMTEAVKSKFTTFQAQQGAMDFTKENVFELVNMLFANRFNILDQAVLDVFDIFTKYHKENRLIIEGWKTNDKFKVNKKVILPYFVRCNYSGKYEYNYSRYTEYMDIDKVMCYLSGHKLENIVTLKEAVSKVSVGDFGKYQSTFFYFRCYKKGTLHIEFKDELLWQEFNMRACDGKHWLPESEKTQWQDTKMQNMADAAFQQIMNETQLLTQ